MKLVSTLASALALSSPATPAPTDGPVVPAVAAKIDAAIVRGEGFDLDEVERALRVRMPSLQLARQSGDLPPTAGLRAFIELRREAEARVQVSLILSDGRAYFRAVDADADAARPVAGALALLIAAIEEDAVAPDQRDVPVPPAIAAPAPAPVPEPAPKPVPEVRCPAPTPCPVAPRPPPPPRLELSPVLRVGAPFGLGPAVPGPRGALGGLGLDVRWLSGAMLAVDLQASGTPEGGYRISRVRGTIGAGYGLRVGAFELPIVGFLGVEGWRVAGVEGGALVSPRGGPRPLFGAGLRLSPGLRARLGPQAAIRVGARVELWVAGEPGPGGLRQPVIGRAGERPFASLGGPELSLAIEVALTFGVRGKSGRTGAKGQVPPRR